MEKNNTTIPQTLEHKTQQLTDKHGLLSMKELDNVQGAGIGTSPSGPIVLRPRY